MNISNRLISLALCLLLLPQLSLAEICPSVKAIKAKQTKGWQAYDSDDGKKLSRARETQFIQNAAAFVLAEWVKTKTESAIHCYYRNKTGGTLEAYLSKHHFKPIKHQAWYEVTGAMHCAAEMQECKFQHIKPLLAKQARLPQKQLAASGR